MAEFIIPDREDLEEILAALGIYEGEDLDVGLVMLAARPAGGETGIIKKITNLPTDRIREVEIAMQREAVWPGLDSWADSSDTEFLLDFLAVRGKLRRIVYGSGDVKYISARQPQIEG